MVEMSYLALFLLVLGVNLLPAFGPPTWSLLVYARLRWHLDPVALVLLGRQRPHWDGSHWPAPRELCVSDSPNGTGRTWLISSSD